MNDTEPKSVNDKLLAGDYANKVPYTVAGTTKDQKVKQRAAWQEEEGRIAQRFQADLAAEHGVTGHPKETRLFQLAWEHGHSSGLHEVAIYYADFVELLKEDPKP